MTTELTRSLSPRLPKPDAYAAHVNRVLSAAKPVPRPKRLLWAAIGLLMLGAALLLAVFV